MEASIKETFFLSAGETNAEGELSLPVLASKIIDIATMHANSLGIGNPMMKDIDAGWVLSRFTIEMNEYPRVNTHYSISTWIEDFNRHYSTRNFMITSPEGKIYGYARTIWMVIDAATHENIGLGHFSLDDSLIAGNKVPIERQAKHIQITENKDEEAKKCLIQNHPSVTHTFGYCDLDAYRHVNTVRYISFLLNQFSLQEHDEYMTKRIELSFMHETHSGIPCRLRQSSEAESGTYSFMLEKAEDNTPLLFARIFLKKRD